jgi:hypothetical protein
MNPPNWHTYRPHPSAADRIAAGPAVNLRLVTHGQPLLGQAPSNRRAYCCAAEQKPAR